MLVLCSAGVVLSLAGVVLSLAGTFFVVQLYVVMVRVLYFINVY